jgi:hypothetical protein
MNIGNRLLLFVYSTPNIVGAFLGIIGLLLYFSGLIDRFWFLIVIGLYGIGILATPRSPSYELVFKNRRTIDEIREELESLIHKIRGKVPKDIFEKVISIKTSIMDVLPQIADLSSSDHNIYLIQQTALDYLPASLENYLNLPKAYANLHPVRNGKTARQLLVEQLDLLDQEMKAVVRDLYSKDMQRLVAHGRFLQDRFHNSL